MIRYDDITQGSPEWHELRWGAIGGTSSGGLFIDSDTLFIKLLSENLEEFDCPDDGFTNFAVQRGYDLEPEAREWISKYSGHDFGETGMIQSSECSILRMSPDGITKDNKHACEIKCPSKEVHTKTVYKNETPKEHTPQILSYFINNPELETLHFLSYRPEAKKNFVSVYTRETIIDMGWKVEILIPQKGVKGNDIKPKIVKESDLRTINEWSIVAIEKAKELQERVEKAVQTINF